MVDQINKSIQPFTHWPVNAKNSSKRQPGKGSVNKMLAMHTQGVSSDPQVP